MQMKAAGVMGVLALALVIGAAPTGPVRAAEPPGKSANAPLELPLEGEATAPDWRTKPTGEEIEREYPQLALMMGLAGGATITCQVEVDGRVDECHVVREWPLGLGFGAAAMRSAAYFTMKPATLDGRPVTGVVTIPLRFQLADVSTERSEDRPLPPVDPTALALARRIAVLQDTAATMQAAWRNAIDREAAAVVANGEAVSGQVVLDAFRQGLDEAITAQVERHAHEVAAKMSVPELRATVAFLASPAGKRWSAAERGVLNGEPQDFARRVALAARVHLCAHATCTAPES